MKKAFLLFTAFCLGIAGNAQTKTYSSNDANLDGEVNISDVNSVISEMCGTPNAVRIVPVDSVCALARSIDSEFGKQLEKKLVKANETKAYYGISTTSETAPSTPDEIFAGTELTSGTVIDFSSKLHSLVWIAVPSDKTVEIYSTNEESNIANDITQTTIEVNNNYILKLYSNIGYLQDSYTVKFY